MQNHSFNRDSFIVSINSEVVDSHCVTIDNLKIKSETENNDLWNTDSYSSVESVEFDVSVENPESLYEYFNKLREENANSEQNNSDK